MAEPKYELKKGIYEAFLKSLTYSPSIDVDDQDGNKIGEEHGDDIEPTADQSVKDLSNMLGDAIIKWVHAQQFTVVDLEISQTQFGVTGAPAAVGVPVTFPVLQIKGSVKDTTQVSPSVDNPKASVESMNSIVELKPDNTIGIEDI